MHETDSFLLMFGGIKIFRKKRRSKSLGCILALRTPVLSKRSVRGAGGGVLKELRGDELYAIFQSVSFDNLGVEQVIMVRLLSTDWMAGIYCALKMIGFT